MVLVFGPKFLVGPAQKNSMAELDHFSLAVITVQKKPPTLRRNAATTKKAINLAQMGHVTSKRV
jgi:hypothetical protein